MLLLAGVLRCIKPVAGIAAFLAIKSPFQQQAGQKEDGKKRFDRGFWSDHVTILQASPLARFFLEIFLNFEVQSGAKVANLKTKFKYADKKVLTCKVCLHAAEKESLPTFF